MAQDAFWILPSSSPLKCTSPSDVYLLLKSSDFISHDLSRDSVFEGCDYSEPLSYDIELVLRKWYQIDRSRELRCFARQDILLGMYFLCPRFLTHIVAGISQRDTNYFDFWNDTQTQKFVTTTVKEFWETHIKGKWDGEGNCELRIITVVKFSY
jgi:hypothetical protein